MNIQNKKTEEQVRDINYINPTINRIIHYSNILNDKIDFFMDNGVTDFSQVDSSDDFQLTNSFNNEAFL